MKKSLKDPLTPQLTVLRRKDPVAAMVKMPLDYEVLSVDVHVEANRIPWAEICFLDGDAALRKFRISESGDFDLGVEVELTLGYVNLPATHVPVFKGIVIIAGSCSGWSCGMQPT